MNILAQAMSVSHQGYVFRWTEPNWGWFFLGVIVGLLVHALIAHWGK